MQLEYGRRTPISVLEGFLKEPAYQIRQSMDGADGIITVYRGGKLLVTIEPRGKFVTFERLDKYGIPDRSDPLLRELEFVCTSMDGHGIIYKNGERRYPDIWFDNTTLS